MLPWWLGYALAAALAMWLLTRMGSDWIEARSSRDTARRRGARAVAGEAEAAALLARFGYRVICRQLALRWVIAVDGEQREVDLRVDLIAERAGRLYVAEVKTGDRAPAIENAATRRQLLEYLVAYGADSALLVNADAGEVVEVDFARDARFSRRTC